MTYPLIQLLSEKDIPTIVFSFAAHHWPKPAATFDAYLAEQKAGKRVMWVATWNNQFAGYITLRWQSGYAPFCEHTIPEIADLNVLPPFRGKGIGSHLLETAEKAAFARYPTVGLGVGLYADYGTAHRIYINRGYMPDGLGITYNYQRVLPGATVILDDDLVMWLTKNAS